MVFGRWKFAEHINVSSKSLSKTQLQQSMGKRAQFNPYLIEFIIHVKNASPFLLARNSAGGGFGEIPKFLRNRQTSIIERSLRKRGYYNPTFLEFIIHKEFIATHRIRLAELWSIFLKITGLSTFESRAMNGEASAVIYQITSNESISILVCLKSAGGIWRVYRYSLWTSLFQRSSEG